MIIGVLREVRHRESRVALLPEHAARLAHAGADMVVEAGIGRSLGIPDEAYGKAGATVIVDRKSLLKDADLVLSIRGPSHEEAAGLKQNAICINLMDPFREKAMVEILRDQGVSAISLEMIPRITRAQKMDVLSPGQLGGIRSGDRGCPAACQDLSYDDDGSRYDFAGPGLYCRGGSGWPSSHSNGKTAGCARGSI